MSADTLEKSRESELPAASRASARVAILCDFLEEKWPSMDLAGDMLYRFLTANHAREIVASQLRPPFNPRLTRLPMFPQKIGSNIDRLANRFLDYPRWLRDQLSTFDLFHLVDHSYSQLLHYLPPDRSVVTCHDLDTFRCLLEPEKDKRPRWFQTMAKRILNGFQRAAHVICVSQATRDLVLRYRLIPPDRLSVIHVGVDSAFTSLPDPAADAEASQLLGPGAEREIRLLSVGSTIPRKRIDILLRVFTAIREEFPTARLIRVGGPFTEPQLQLARELGLEKSISILPFVSTTVLASLYRKSDLLLLPSDAEGFGMPLTEALACGCQVLASDLDVFREVGGTVCTYRPVGDVGAWTSAAVHLLRMENSELWRQQAREQAAHYSWEENARQTVQVYNRVLSLKKAIAR
jgi:glycosyltransferase involved in cell wall biosynthesis